MYKGFSMTRYKKLMAKLELNAPTHLAHFFITYETMNKTFGLLLRNIPVYFDIVDVSVTPAEGSSSYITRKFQVIVNKKYFEGQMLEAADTEHSKIYFYISEFVAGKDNGGYTTKITLVNGNASTPVDEEGYGFPQNFIDVNYGDYSDGAYRQYIELTCVSTIIY